MQGDGHPPKLVEFGHKIILSQARQKFITNYRTLEFQKPDNQLTGPAFDAHKATFGTYPEVGVGDKGMGPGAKNARPSRRR